jgi:hypothetical protein
MRYLSLFSGLEGATLAWHHLGCNCLSTPHSTPFKGVCRQKGSKTFRVQIGAHGVKHYLGMSKTAEDGARIYDEAAKRLHGEFAWTN